MADAAAYRIEQARTDDAEAVIDLFIEDLTELRAPIGEREALLRVFQGLLAEPRATVLVVRHVASDRAVGVLVANEILSVKFAGRSLWIEELYVGRRWRRNGLGRMMVEALLDQAREAGVRGIDLEAYQGNAPAAMLYRALGFRRLGRERFHFRYDWEEEA